MTEPHRSPTRIPSPYDRGGPRGTLGRAVARLLRRSFLGEQSTLEIPPDVAEKLELPGLPPDMVARRGHVARGVRVRTTVVAVVTSAVLTGLGGYYLGVSAVGERSEDRIEGLAAGRDYWHRTANDVHATWERRDVCEAEIRAEGENPRVWGIFPAPELRACYVKQEARVAQLNARGGGGAAE